MQHSPALARPRALAFGSRPAHRLAALACAMPLALAVASANADTTGLERVEVRGTVIEAPARYNVRDGCERIDDQLQGALQATWLRERQMGQVQVQMVLDHGQVTSVSARGISVPVARSVRRAVQTLHCSSLTSATGPQIYRFRVDFTDPYAATAQHGLAPLAEAKGSPSGYRLALLSD